ncbi:hypothetical protein V1387_00705 [Allomuricauda taeanensis]|uniref:TPR end-of-group domain-containing protein n=1 Tax=Flagellimonas taeanensis TaxID=1005926 RepID=UPI002E7B7792|nr:hypothetical protein [Allomuricauda taeanensis]MEE1961182.1 hypothetical protein [Allomuricauda taeanensis]
MKKILLQLILFFSFCQATCQELKGVVYYYESNGKPASDIKISVLGCPHTYSNEDGTFVLKCPQKEVGNRAILTIGPFDKNGDLLELVNSDNFEYLAFPSNPNDILHEIYVGPPGTRQRRIEALRPNIEQSLTKELLEQIKENEREISSFKKTESELKSVRTKLEQTKAQLEIAQKEAKNLAEYLSGIDKTRTSKTIEKVIMAVEANKDLKEALKLLDLNQILDSYDTAMEEKNMAISNIVAALKLRVNISMSQRDYDEALKSLKIIERVYIENNFSPEHMIILYSSLAYASLHNGDNEIAEEYLIKSFKVSENLSSAGISFLLNYYDINAILYNSLNKPDQAIEFSNMRLGILKKIDIKVPCKEMLLGMTYFNLGSSYHLKGEISKGIGLSELGFETINLCPDIDESLLFGYKLELLISYSENGQYEKSLKLSDELTSMFKERSMDTITVDYSDLLYFTANTHLKKHNYKEAKKFSDNCLRIRELLYDEDHFLMGMSYSMSALINAGLDYNETALEEINRALDIYRKYYINAFDTRIVDAQKVKSHILFKLGRLEESIDQISKVLYTEEEHGVGNEIDLANTKANYGWLLFQVDSINKSIDYQNKALEIRERLLPENHSSLGQSHYNMALTYYSLDKNNIDKALFHIKRAWPIIEKQHSKTSPTSDKVRTLRNKLYTLKGAQLTNESKFEDALKLFFEVFEDDENFVMRTKSLGEISVAQLIGSAYLMSNEYELAIKYFDIAIRIVPEFKYQSYYEVLGVCNLKMGLLEKAKDYFLIHKEYNSVDPSVYWNLAKYYVLKKESQEAMKNLEKAVEFGYSDILSLKTDDDFQPIRSSKRFRKLLKTIKKRKKTISAPK